jgi:hypothetical protein
MCFIRAKKASQSVLTIGEIGFTEGFGDNNINCSNIFSQKIKHIGTEHVSTMWPRNGTKDIPPNAPSN